MILLLYEMMQGDKVEYELHCTHTHTYIHVYTYTHTHTHIQHAMLYLHVVRVKMEYKLPWHDQKIFQKRVVKLTSCTVAVF